LAHAHRRIDSHGPRANPRQTPVDEGLAVVSQTCVRSRWRVWVPEGSGSLFVPPLQHSKERHRWRIDPKGCRTGSTRWLEAFNQHHLEFIATEPMGEIEIRGGAPEALAVALSVRRKLEAVCELGLSRTADGKSLMCALPLNLRTEPAVTGISRRLGLGW
jgi:hypothetical protein